MKDCDGLRFIRTTGQKTHLIHLLNCSFDTTNGEDILCSMQDARQYYILHKHRVASIVTLKKNALSRTGEWVSFMLYNACTHPRFQNQGLMSRLITHVERSIGTQESPSYLSLEVLKKNIPALCLYHKLGFQFCRDFGEGILMRKRVFSHDLHVSE